MKIPIENIYYLLCYAWNKLEEKDRVNVSMDGVTRLQDLFAKILINGTRMLLKRGLDKSYVEETDRIAGIKGKLQLAATLKANTYQKHFTVCTYDEFSADILFNRILFSTIFRLTRVGALDLRLREELNLLYRMAPSVQLIALDNRLFAGLRYNRNNRFYEFLMHVCQIIFQCTLPGQKAGMLNFSDFTEDENKMNQLFEAFIRNFFRVEQQRFTRVGRERIRWQLTEQNVGDAQHLPGMETDVTLESETEKMIIDAKYYRQTMAGRYDAEKLHSQHLYQLFSYLLNQEVAGNAKTLNATGMLVYPTVSEGYALDYTYKSHPVKIRTLNLMQPWNHIARDLLAFVVAEYVTTSAS